MIFLLQLAVQTPTWGISKLLEIIKDINIEKMLTLQGIITLILVVALIKKSLKIVKLVIGIAIILWILTALSLI